MRRLVTILVLASVLGFPHAAMAASVVATWPVGHQPFGLVVDPSDGRVYVANSGGTTVSVVDPATGTVRSVVTGGQPGLMALDGSSHRLYVSNSGDGSLAVVDTATLSVVATLAGAGGLGVAVDPATRRVYVARASELVVVDGATNAVVSRVPAMAQSWFGVALDPALHRVYVTNIASAAPSLVVLDDRDLSHVAEVALPKSVRYALAVDAMTRAVYLASEDPAGPPFANTSFYVVDATALTIVSTTALGGYPISVALSPATRRIYVTDQGGQRVRELDDATFAVTQSIALPWQPAFAAMHPDGRLYVAAYQGFGADVLGAIRLTNAAPVIDGVTLSPSSPMTNDTVRATVTAHDSDGDALSFAYEWSRNGAVIVGATGAALDLSVAGNGDRGDTISVRVTASDGQDTSAPVTASVLVADSAPAAGVTLDNVSPATNAVLTATASATDADHDALTYAFTWKVNGVVRRTASGPSATDSFDLGVTGNGDRGNTVVVEVVASDGTLSSGVAAATATVANTAPTVTVTLNTSRPESDDVLIARAVGRDLDGDALSFTYTWRVNGMVKRTVTKSAATDRFDLGVRGNGDRRDVVTVTATASDGTATSPAATATATVR